MKAHLLIYPCPWCKKTPEVSLPYQFHSKNSWSWQIKCMNADCKMQPETKIVAIRNTTKTDAVAIMYKLEKLVSIWNTGNDCAAKDWKVIDLEPILRGKHA